MLVFVVICQRNHLNAALSIAANTKERQNLRVQILCAVRIGSQQEIAACRQVLESAVYILGQLLKIYMLFDLLFGTLLRMDSARVVARSKGIPAADVAVHIKDFGGVSGQEGQEKYSKSSFPHS